MHFFVEEVTSCIRCIAENSNKRECWWRSEKDAKKYKQKEKNERPVRERNDNGKTNQPASIYEPLSPTPSIRKWAINDFEETTAQILDNMKEEEEEKKRKGNVARWMAKIKNESTPKSPAKGSSDPIFPSHKKRTAKNDSGRRSFMDAAAGHDNEDNQVTGGSVTRN